MPSSPDALRPPAGPRATVVGALLEGWRRVLRAPYVTLGVLAATLALAVPMAMLLGLALERQLGASLEAERVLSGWSETWASDIAAGAEGLLQTFTHEILGFGATLSTLSRFVDAATLNPTVAVVVAAYVAVWVFLSGGILDRLARARPVRTSAFFGACGVYFFRFLRLAVVAGALYWALFRWVHPWLFVTVYGRWTRDLTAETQGVAIRLFLYAVFLMALAVVSAVVDFAKVRAVVEDRRSAISALGASMRFIRRRPWRVAALYLLNILVALVIARLWLQTAPAASSAVWLAFFAGQIYVLFRIWAKLAFMASEVAFFQGELAHAGYTARPEPRWPDSASVEAVRNLGERAPQG